LNQIPSVSARAKGGDGGDRAGPQRNVVGEFSASALAIVTPLDVESTAAEGASQADAGLGAELTASDPEIEESAAAERAGIMREFAGAIEAARKRLPRHAARGAVAALKQMRKAALTLVKRRATEQRAGRKKLIRAARRSVTGKRGQRPGNSAPRLH
jgi:hypothetical protein